MFYFDYYFDLYCLYCAHPIYLLCLLWFVVFGNYLFSMSCFHVWFYTLSEELIEIMYNFCYVLLCLVVFMSEYVMLCCVYVYLCFFLSCL